MGLLGGPVDTCVHCPAMWRTFRQDRPHVDGIGMRLRDTNLSEYLVSLTCKGKMSNYSSPSHLNGLLETEGYVLLFPPPAEVFIYISTIYLQSSGVIYNIKYY